MQLGKLRLTDYEDRLKLRRIIRDLKVYDLILAARRGYEKRIKYILSTSPYEFFTTNLNVAFKEAIQAGHLDIMKYLFACGADARGHDDDCIILATRTGNLALVKYLISICPKTDLSHALGEAAMNGYLAIVEYLVSEGASINQYIFYRAIMGGHLNVIKYLIFNGQYQGQDHSILLNCAATNGHLHVIKYLTDSEFSDLLPEDILDIREYGETMLCIAAERGHLALVKYLVTKNCYIMNYTLQIAVARGYMDIVKHLVENGANIHMWDGEKLLLSCGEPWEEIRRYLKSKGANVNESP